MFKFKNGTNVSEVSPGKELEKIVKEYGILNDKLSDVVHNLSDAVDDLKKSLNENNILQL